VDENKRIDAERCASAAQFEQSVGARFVQIRLLKRSNGITTFRGFDRRHGGEVLMKAMPAESLSPTASARLEFEVAALNQLVGVALPGALTLERAADQIYLARPFVPGVTLESWLSEKPLPLEAAISIAIGILSSLELVHPHGILHRDIKPSNIIIDSTDHRTGLLVDFGIARHARLASSLRDLPFETARYLSPEQSGLLDGGLDARSDLYAVGVTLYESIARRAPFFGPSIKELLRQHLTIRPQPLRKLNPDVPPALERIVERLLRKDPRDRYQTADGARADLEELLAALDRGVTQPDIIVGARDARRALTEPAFIGRQAELEALESALDEATEGNGSLVLLEADSGGGKTWLLEEFAKRAAHRAVWILHGQGLNQEAQRPFQVIAGLVRELLAGVDEEVGRERHLADQLGPHRAALCASLPELSAILGAEQKLLGPVEHGEARSIAALGALLDALGSPERPAVVLLDDGQWADEPTLSLLEKWQQLASRRSDRHTLVVVAFRSGEVCPDHPLRKMEGRHLFLPPFSNDDVRQEVASMAGKLPEEAIQIVIRQGEGNPFLVAATLHGLVETGVLRAGPSAWELNPQALTELQASARVANILALRLTQLAPRPRQLLTVGAILGRTFDPVLAGALCGMEPREAMQEAETCRGGLLWVNGSGTLFTFLHDRIREALLTQMTTEERRRLHRLAAEHIQASSRERVFELAYHFDAAGDAEGALPYAVVAAERAQRQFALELAECYYRIALRGAAQADVSLHPTLRFRIEKGLGDVIALRSRFDEAAEQYRTALALAPSAEARAEVEERWAQLEVRRGDLLAACKHAESALRHVGRWVPRNKVVCTVGAAFEFAIQMLHSQFPRLFIGRRSLADAERDLFVIRLYHGMNAPYFFSKGAAWASWAHLKSLNLAERYPPTVELGRVYGVHGSVIAGFPRLWERGIRITKRGAEICRSKGDLWGEAQALTFQSIVLQSASRLEESVEVGREGARLFDRTGDRWETHTGLCYVGGGYFRMGNLRAARDEAEQLWHRAKDLGDVRAVAWALDVWSRATDGRVLKEFVQQELEHSREHLQSRLMVSQAEAVRLLGEGRAEEAATLLEKALDQLRKEAGFFHDYNAPMLVYLVAALRMHAEQIPSWDPKRRRRLIDRAWRELKRALPIARKFRNNLAHALREAAYVRAMRGDSKGARRDVEESIAIADEFGQRYERALSRQARGRLGAALGWPGAVEELARADEEVRSFRGAFTDLPAEPTVEQTTLSLIDRFSTILEAGRTIAIALSRETVFTALREAAMSLLRAERCVVLEYEFREGRPELRPVFGDARLPFNPGLAERAIRTGEPVVLSLSKREPIDESLHRAAVRSALYVPISVRGRPFGCIYVTHGEVNDLFQLDEQRIASFLTTLAGAALENADGFAQIQAFSRVLESRVEERTVELARANEELQLNLQRLREAQNQVVQAGKMAAVGTLIAGLSHELNNPLGIILGYVQTLLKLTPDKDRTREPLLAIERQARRCGQLVRALLDFSRPKPSAREPMQPAELVANVMDLLAGQAKSYGVEVKIVIPETIEVVYVCPQEIESALLNLLSNALDATSPSGRVEVEVDAVVRDKREGVQFVVRDTGIGIPPDVLPRIFDPFFTTKPEGQGTGLGLALAHQIVQAHDGVLEAESTPDVGTVMRLWLPRWSP
jgi:signal transduction histidine kinase